MATSARVRVEAVPRRRAARSARAAWCTSDSWKGSEKTALGRSALACLPSIGALIAAVVSAIGAHLDRCVAPARDRAPDQQQIALGVDLDDRSAPLGHPGAPHPSRHAHPLEHASGIGAGADRPRRADVVGAVAHRAPAEVVALDRALEALADRDSRDLHLLARLEVGDGDVVADLALLALAG